MSWFHKHSAPLITIGLPFLLLLTLLRSLLFQISTALFDWNDYPLYIWIINQNIEHITAFSFTHFFNGNIFYPATHTLLFSDLFLPQSLLALPLSLMSTNPVLVFNIVFFLTLFLNVITARYMWSAFFTKWWQLLFAIMTTVISSFVFQNWYHFQILSLWPLLLTLGFFFKQTPTLKSALVGGLLLSLVLYSGVYYWVFLITILTIWYATQALYSKNLKALLPNTVKFASVTLSVFILLSGITLFNYWQTRQLYNAQREYGEYITYSAHLSDYIFPAHMSSALWGTKLVRKWNQFNQHSGVFPGLTVTILATMGLVTIIKKKKIIIAVELTQHGLFFLILTIVGFIFSLGPRFNFNGQYLSVPLPYHLLLKTNPLFEVVRVTSRWSLLFFFGLTYFSSLGLKKTVQRFGYLMVAIAIATHLLEVYPLSWQFTSQQYYPSVYEELQQRCQVKPQVLLEYPLTQFKDGATIVTNLTYRSQMMLAATKHRCLLINGYSGYIPKDYEQYEHNLFWSTQAQNFQTFKEMLIKRQTKLIKLNRRELYADHEKTMYNWLITEQEFTTIYQSDDYLLVEYGQHQ